MTTIAQEIQTLVQLRNSAARNGQTESNAKGIQWTLIKIALEIEAADSPEFTADVLDFLRFSDQLFIADYLENAGYKIVIS
jgi:hypothetical protein